MKSVTSEMIKKYELKKSGYDFMGYKIHREDSLSFHHLILSKHDCKKMGIGKGYWEWNGAILVQNTSHEYLHRIQNLNEKIFYLITSEMIDENIKGKLDIENLKEIRKLLLYFEEEHINDTTKDGKPLIKKEYIKDRIIL